MPWDGSQNYQLPLGTYGEEDQTIESNKYNNFLDDLCNSDLNVARPIHRGGTSATTADQAIDNLKAEKAGQVVTNYNAITWRSGSFYSDAGATGAPIAGHRFVGMVAVQDASNMIIEAFDLDSVPAGEMYTQVKKDGVWQNGGAWGTGWVKKTGDTMTGPLVLIQTSPLFAMAKSASAQANYMNFHTGLPSATSLRWQVMPGNTSQEIGGNRGSDFQISRFDDAGAFLGPSLIIQRETGGVSLEGKIYAPAKGHMIGTLGGPAANAGVSPTDANIIFYDAGAGNWNGIGADPSGNMWFRTGLSGSPVPAFYINNTQTVVFNKPINVPAPIGPDDAVTKAYADTKLPLAGGVMSGVVTIVGSSTLSPANSGAGFWYGNTAAPSGRFFVGVDGPGGDAWRIFSNLFGNALTVSSAGAVSVAVDPTAPTQVATKRYVDNKVGVLAYLPTAGGTMAGKLYMANTAAPYAHVSFGGSGGAIEVMSYDNNTAALITFHRPGAFACNFGLDYDNELAFGGWSFGGTRYRLWSERHGGWPVSTFRYAYAGDYGHGIYTGIVEPWNAIVTGMAGFDGVYTITARYRYAQMYTNGWYTVGFA